MIKHIANIITGCRIIGSCLLLFFPVFSAEFIVIYIICGLSDMIDGTIARKTNSANDFGAKIDTVADILFVAAALIKILPVITLPLWLWIWGGLIAVIKISNIIRGYFYKNEFVSLHTAMNKVTGFMLFVIPLTWCFIEAEYSLIAVCMVATFSALQEGYYVAKGC